MLLLIIWILSPFPPFSLTLPLLVQLNDSQVPSAYPFFLHTHCLWKCSSVYLECSPLFSLVLSLLTPTFSLGFLPSRSLLQIQLKFLFLLHVPPLCFWRKETILCLSSHLCKWKPWSINMHWMNKEFPIQQFLKMSRCWYVGFTHQERIWVSSFTWSAMTRHHVSSNSRLFSILCDLQEYVIFFQDFVRDMRK